MWEKLLIGLAIISIVISFIIEQAKKPRKNKEKKYKKEKKEPVVDAKPAVGESKPTADEDQKEPQPVGSSETA